MWCANIDIGRQTPGVTVVDEAGQVLLEPQPVNEDAEGSGRGSRRWATLRTCWSPWRPPGTRKRLAAIDSIAKRREPFTPLLPAIPSLDAISRKANEES